MTELQNTIEQAWQNRKELSKNDLAAFCEDSVGTVMSALESGELRVAKPLENGEWHVNEWLKKAVLLYFSIHDNYVMEGTTHNFYDKVPCRFGSGIGDLICGRSSVGSTGW